MSFLMLFHDVVQVLNRELQLCTYQLETVKSGERKTFQMVLFSSYDLCMLMYKRNEQIYAKLLTLNAN